MQETRELRLIATREESILLSTEQKRNILYNKCLGPDSYALSYITRNAALRVARNLLRTVPANWSDQDILDFLERPMAPRGRYPAWEIPARLFFSPRLFKWWAAQRPRTPLA